MPFVYKLSLYHWSRVDLMGNLCSAFQNIIPLNSNLPSKILFLGLSGAGKTSILYRLKRDDSFEITPTIGFNVETVLSKSVSFTIWDVRGESRHSPLWRHFFAESKGIVFVVDAADPSTFCETKEALDWILSSDEIEGVLFVLLVNKQDLPQAATPSDVVKKIGLDKVRDRKVHVQGTSVRTGEGLLEAMTELGRMINNDNQHTPK